jgi:hypothetical protein
VAKKNDLYYLFPGQGGGKRKRFIRDIVVGCIVGLILAGAMAGLFYALGQ